jgi:hypothetical protein
MPRCDGIALVEADLGARADQPTAAAGRTILQIIP